MAMHGRVHDETWPLDCMSGESASEHFDTLNDLSAFSPRQFDSVVPNGNSVVIMGFPFLIFLLEYSESPSLAYLVFMVSFS